MVKKISRTEEEWQRRLTPEQYEVTRNKGTEIAFTGKYDKHDKTGTYKCAACGNPLFSSENKFDSGTGWPSFSAPLSCENVEQEEDASLEMVRTEVLCSACGAHWDMFSKTGRNRGACATVSIPSLWTLKIKIRPAKGNPNNFIRVRSDQGGTSCILMKD